jgi:hypothetical protein
MFLPPFVVELIVHRSSVFVNGAKRINAISVFHLSAHPKTEIWWFSRSGTIARPYRYPRHAKAFFGVGGDWETGATTSDTETPETPLS